MFDEQYPGLVRYAYRLTGDGDVAQDVAQEAFVRLFSRDARPSSESARAWLFTTATRIARDLHRIGSNRKRLLEKTPLETHAPSTPAEKLDRVEDRRLARGALAVLPERDREILLMRYSGFSYREIARAVDVAETSIGTMLARAERKFARAAEEVEGANA